MDMYSNAQAIVDLAALRENYEKIKKYAGESQIIAVVKADAYGHGARECSRVFYECGCRFFAVATVSEALELRRCFGDCEILILGLCPPAAARVLAENNIIAALGSYEYAKELCNNLPSGCKLRCHLKLDTGMNRIGFSWRDDDFSEILGAFSLEKLKIEGMFSHFACADMPCSDMTDIQQKRFLHTDRKLKENGINLKVRHISNSAAAIYRPDTHMDFVRCGIILYGLNPSKEAPAKELTPVMTLKTHVTHVHTLHSGESVGYGASFTAQHDMEIATLPIGYADGFIRAYANGGYMLINGHKCPIVGRICMDQCMADISGANVRPGDEAEIFGKHTSVDVFARAANTINYECTCLLSDRVERVYTDDI